MPRPLAAVVFLACLSCLGFDDRGRYRCDRPEETDCVQPQFDHGASLEGFVSVGADPLSNSRGNRLRDDSFSWGDLPCDPQGNCLTGGFTP